QEVFNEYDRGKEEVALRNLQEKVVPVSMDLLSRYEELAEHRESVIDEMGEKNIAQGEMLILVSAIISVVTVVFSIVIALFTSSIITKPLITVMNRMKEIAVGDLSQASLEKNTQDETGQLVDATNEMNNN